MKKILGLMMVVLILLLTACSMQAAPVNPNYKPDVQTPAPTMEPETVQETPTVAPVKTEESVDPDVLYAGMIPDPAAIFANGDVTITDSDGGKAYIFEVTGYNTEEYETYISQCKEMGFTDVSFETDEDFGAYSEDGRYWVQLSIDNDKDILYVICQTSRNK